MQTISRGSTRSDGQSSQTVSGSARACCALCGALGGAHAPVTPRAAALLQTWVTAREAWLVEDRAALLDLVLLSGISDSIADAAAALFAQASSHTGLKSVPAPTAWLAEQLIAAGGKDIEPLHDAWDEGAVCPLGVGLPPLAAIRSDLPLQPGYRALPAAQRLVLLALAGEAGHRAVRADAHVLARRTGLNVADVRVACDSLAVKRWTSRQGSSTSAIVIPAPAMFLPLWAGPWARRARRH